MGPKTSKEEEKYQFEKSLGGVVLLRQKPSHARFLPALQPAVY